MSIKVLNDRILLEPDDPEPKASQAGIDLPDSVRQKMMSQVDPTDFFAGEATVIVTGPGHKMPDGKYVSLSVQAGDRVLVFRRMVSVFRDKADGRWYGLCGEDAIIGVKESVSPSIVSELSES